MTDMNYIGGIVRILEIPKQKILNNNISIVKIRVQFPQFKNIQIVNLIFWGNLARDILNYYKVNDYIIIEGYLGLANNQSSDLTIQNLKKVEITVLKIYPFLLSSNINQSTKNV
uniref:Hypothetical chloroplast RF41 n=1 Tax=Amicula sp. isolate GU52X-4 cfCalB7 TaxID=3003489 RepID=A0A9E9C209_9STRA|nr:hypothetical chloroplast RF41 [Amicula sp. isolate GU52X-4 cfCalB7]